jgi:nucleotide-binding universal stress UspA family protein
VKIERVLLCVDGSTVALEATRLAIGLAGDWGARMRAVYVVGDLGVAAQIDAAAPRGEPPAEERLAIAGGDVLANVDRLGRQADVATETVLRHGEAIVEILREARAFRPDFVVIGRNRRLGPGPTVIGTVTAQMLEFAEWPVIVVPGRAGDRSGGG